MCDECVSVRVCARRNVCCRVVSSSLKRVVGSDVPILVGPLASLLSCVLCRRHARNAAVGHVLALRSRELMRPSLSLFHHHVLSLPLCLSRPP